LFQALIAAAEFEGNDHTPEIKKNCTNQIPFWQYG
jgi:hypothetical protein